MALKIYMVVIHPMKIVFHSSTGKSGGVMVPAIRRIAGILMALLLASEVRAQASQGTYSVKLEWSASTSTDVTGYRIHYGTSSGSRTASVVVGNVASGTVSGLVDGVTYYFVVSALNAGDLESGFSNEVSFKPGLHTSRIQTSASGETVVIVQGLIGSQYDIEASEDLKSWSVIETVTMPQSASLEFSDPDAGTYPKRFYRTRQRP